MKPVISIIIPIYNVERYLTQCLDSILQQDYLQWECILVDDGSKDRSGAICDEFLQRDKRFHVVHKTNGGVSSARNVGLVLAKGEWICFVDSDDRLVEGALTYMLELNLRTNADVCLCPIVKGVDLPLRTKILDEYEKKELIWSCLAYRTGKYAAKGFMVDAPHAKLFRALIIKNKNLKYVEGLCKSEDALFDAQFYHYADCIVMGTHPVYLYTTNPNSICHTYKYDNIPMFGILLQHEEDFVNGCYKEASMFKDVLKIRAFVALEQVLYEAGANELPLSNRITALQLFMNSGIVRMIVSSTLYSQIAPYLQGRSKHFDLWLIQHQLLCMLCFWVDWCDSFYRLRVVVVEGVKKFLGISLDKPLSSLFCK